MKNAFFLENQESVKKGHPKKGSTVILRVPLLFSSAIFVTLHFLREKLCSPERSFSHATAHLVTFSSITEHRTCAYAASSWQQAAVMVRILYTELLAINHMKRNHTGLQANVTHQLHNVQVVYYSARQHGKYSTAQCSDGAVTRTFTWHRVQLLTRCKLGFY